MERSRCNLPEKNPLSEKAQKGDRPMRPTVKQERRSVEKVIIESGMTVCQFIERMDDLMKSCNLTSCRYNHNGICQNEDKRKECVDVSKLVLCLEDKEDERE